MKKLQTKIGIITAGVSIFLLTGCSGNHLSTSAVVVGLARQIIPVMAQIVTPDKIDFRSDSAARLTQVKVKKERKPDRKINLQEKLKYSAISIGVTNAQLASEEKDEKHSPKSKL